MEVNVHDLLVHRTPVTSGQYACKKGVDDIKVTIVHG